MDRNGGARYVSSQVAVIEGAVMAVAGPSQDCSLPRFVLGCYMSDGNKPWDGACVGVARGRSTGICEQLGHYWLSRDERCTTF